MEELISNSVLNILPNDDPIVAIDRIKKTTSEEIKKILNILNNIKINCDTEKHKNFVIQEKHKIHLLKELELKLTRENIMYKNSNYS